MKKKFLNSSINLIKKNKSYTQDEIDIISYGLESIYLIITKAIVIFTIAIMHEPDNIDLIKACATNRINADLIFKIPIAKNINPSCADVE